mmetsp:Transcript_60267/g.107469  ORF Transcript_60267/g.107469 Transcript_60267/m.107469 type:complete len:97 (-) Transcript_60267:325-615(-)
MRANQCLNCSNEPLIATTKPQLTTNWPNRRPADHVHMVCPYFKAAESSSSLGLTQFRGFGPHPTLVTVPIQILTPDGDSDPSQVTMSPPQTTSKTS